MKILSVPSLTVDAELFGGKSNKSVLVKVNAKRIDARDKNVNSKIKLKHESKGQSVFIDSGSPVSTNLVSINKIGVGNITLNYDRILFLHNFTMLHTALFVFSDFVWNLKKRVV